MEKRQLVQYESLRGSWDSISQFLFTPKNDDDLNKLIDLADYLMDNLSKKGSYRDLLHIVGNLIHEYESLNFSKPDSTGTEALKYLMKEQGLRQRDLSELGSPGVISEILSGKRELNKRHISALSKRFGCSPAIFF